MVRYPRRHRPDSRRRLLREAYLTFRRTALAALAALVFAAGFTQCNPPAKFSCASPRKLDGYHGTIQYPGNIQVQSDVWTEQGQQTMWVCGPQNWRADVTQSGAPATGVKTYPDSQRTFTDWQHCSSQPPISTVGRLVGTAAHVAPKNGSWDYGWDVFLNGSLCGKIVTEIMVWNQWRGISVPAAQLHLTSGGVAYDLYWHKNSSVNYFQFRRHSQTAGATVDLLALMRYLQGKGLISGADTLQFAAYGPEVLTTGGVKTPFWLTRFSVAR